MDVRLDKWLQIARVFKTRSQATRACNQGRVKLNGSLAKAHKAVRPEDKLEIRFGRWKRILVVKGLRTRPVAKSEAATLYEDLSPPKPARDPMDRILSLPPEERERGKGRPTKKERRAIERLKKGP